MCPITTRVKGCRLLGIIVETSILEIHLQHERGNTGGEGEALK